MPSVEVEGLTLRRSGITILDGLSFQVPAGGLACILGPTGCGKSSLLRILGGLIGSYGGRVQIGGRPPKAGRAAFVFQTPRLVPWRDALGNVLLGLELRTTGLTGEARRLRARHYLRAVGLEDAAHRMPAVLSGGERQRVAMARALAVEPELLLMDEPLANLDFHARRELRRLILRLWRETGATILFVTHDIGEAVELGTRLILLSDKPSRVRRVDLLPGDPPRDVHGGPPRDLVGQIERGLAREGVWS